MEDHYCLEVCPLVIRGRRCVIGVLPLEWLVADGGGGASREVG